MRRWARRVVPYLIAAGIVALLLRQIDPQQVVKLLLGVDPGWLLAGFACYVLTNILRAYRFGALFGASLANKEGENRPLLSPWRLLPEMFALSLLNNTLPSRGGELSFPYFMRRRHGMSVGESSAALVVARIFDYLAIALLYILFALLNRQRLGTRAATAVMIVAGLVLVSVLVLAAAPWLGQRALLMARTAIARLGWTERPWTALLLRGGERAVATLGRTRGRRVWTLTALWSLLTWLGVFGWFAAFMQGIGLPQPFPLVIVGATFAMLAKAVPFITIGGFGAHEAGWLVGFSLVGMPPDAAIASGFAVNILTLLASAIFGGAALVWIRLHPGRSGASVPINDAAAPVAVDPPPGVAESS